MPEGWTNGQKIDKAKADEINMDTVIHTVLHIGLHPKVDVVKWDTS